jgi:hypothetical protein
VVKINAWYPKRNTGSDPVRLLPKRAIFPILADRLHSTHCGHWWDDENGSVRIQGANFEKHYPALVTALAAVLGMISLIAGWRGPNSVDERPSPLQFGFLSPSD